MGESIARRIRTTGKHSRRHRDDTGRRSPSRRSHTLRCCVLVIRPGSSQLASVVHAVVFGVARIADRWLFLHPGVELVAAQRTEAPVLIPHGFCTGR